jgi:hypothetical protein
MSETERLIIENALAGVEAPALSETFHMDETDVQSLLAFAIQIVREYQITGNVPFFECETLDQARANKLQFLYALSKIRIWDELQRPVVKAIFQGAPWAQVSERYQVAKPDADVWVNETIQRIATHLKGGDLDAFIHAPATWVKTHQSRVMDILDRLTSWTHGRQLKNIRTEQVEAQVA